MKDRLANWVGPLRVLTQLSGDVEIAREALRLGIQSGLAELESPDPDLYRWALDLARADMLPHLYWEQRNALRRISNIRQVRRAFGPITQVLLAQPVAIRADLLTAILHDLPHTADELRDELIRIPRHLPRLVRFIGATGWVAGDWAVFVRCALVLDRAIPDGAEAWLDWLLTYLADRAAARPQTAEEQERGQKAPPELTYEEYESLGVGVRLGVTVAEGDPQIFRAIVRAVLEHPALHDFYHLQQALPAAGRFPGLRAALAQIFPRQPRRCATLLSQVSLATRLGAAVLAPLAALETDPLDPADPQAFPPDWQPVLALAPEVLPAAAAYLHAQRLRGGAPDLPPGVRAAVEQPATLARELAHLEGKLAAGTARPDLAIRAANLRARLVAADKLRAAVRGEVAERLRQITAEAQLAAIEHQVRACYLARLAQVAGPLPADLEFDTDLLNATLLTADITQNRRLLLRLLRAYLAGDRAWPEHHPANVAFLQALAAPGVDTTAWLGAHPRGYRCAGAAGGRVRLHLERDPLRILQMGNYFDTCLSFGGGNAFSTVANACELNKRVIYATDGAGQVVGRKLIGLTAESRLIGFRTYSTLGGPAAPTALHAIFRRYVVDFAARCRLALADEGTVPRLFAEAWYDDGAMPWTDEFICRQSSGIAAQQRTGCFLTSTSPAITYTHHR